MISKKEFQTLSDQYAVVPLVETILADLHTPVSIYLTLRSETAPSFLLESVEPDERIGRFSFVGTDPLLMIKAKGDAIDIESNGTTERRRGKILDVLEEFSDRYRNVAEHEQQGFAGGFLGYFGYDRVNEIEHIPLHPVSEQDVPDAMFGLFQSVVKFDHLHQLLTVTHNVIIEKRRPLDGQYDLGVKILKEILERLGRPPLINNSFHCDLDSVGDGADRNAYCSAVARAKEYIHEGDIFQVVLSRRVQVPFSGDPFPVYRALRIINPSPYLFYLDFGPVKLIGSSPEVLVRVQDRTVTVMPIAGTRKRGKTGEEDKHLEEELLLDEKEAAEHVMLVDLGRNDIGRVSEFGTVHVPLFKRLKRFSHVMHLVSEVQGKLKEHSTSIDAMRACFPAGTVSGAPKVRAMEIIHELEPVRRGIYAGAVGYLGFNGALDTCIAIRTVVAANSMLTIQAGAGIVADSVPEQEYKETENKAQALLDALAVASNGLLKIHSGGNSGGQP
ncbi:MAG: anthranilate synthase component I [Ignavibacteriae bacterium]|nr:MAG: anthranilate synthase component I [Ignavibacteriota bacterium]